MKEVPERHNPVHCWTTITSMCMSIAEYSSIAVTWDWLKITTGDTVAFDWYRSGGCDHEVLIGYCPNPAHMVGFPANWDQLWCGAPTAPTVLKETALPHNCGDCFYICATY